MLLLICEHYTLIYAVVLQLLLLYMAAVTYYHALVLCKILLYLLCSELVCVQHYACTITSKVVHIHISHALTLLHL